MLYMDSVVIFESKFKIITSKALQLRIENLSILKTTAASTTLNKSLYLGYT